MIRAKFYVDSKKANPNVEGTDVKMWAVYDDGTPENQRFATSTPSGSLEMLVTNEAALAQLELGKAYYLDISPVEAPEAAPAS